LVTSGFSVVAAGVAAVSADMLSSIDVDKEGKRVGWVFISVYGNL
jgi:hypothetical protein